MPPSRAGAAGRSRAKVTGLGECRGTPLTPPKLSRSRAAVTRCPVTAADCGDWSPIDARRIDVELAFHCNGPESNADLAEVLTLGLVTAQAAWRAARAAHDDEAEAAAVAEWQD